MTFKEGDRVRLKRELERYPHFIAPAGAAGLVVIADPDETLWVRMDEHLEGCEEWDNEIHFSPEYEEGPPDEWLESA